MYSKSQIAEAIAKEVDNPEYSLTLSERVAISDLFIKAFSTLPAQPVTNIVDASSWDLGDNFGIPQSRRDQISEGLNKYVSQFTTLELVRKTDVFHEIELLCESLEEYVWAISLHNQWRQRKGYLVL